MKKTSQNYRIVQYLKRHKYLTSLEASQINGPFAPHPICRLASRVSEINEQPYKLFENEIIEGLQPAYPDYEGKAARIDKIMVSNGTSRYAKYYLVR